MMRLQPCRPQRRHALHHLIAILIVPLAGVAHAQTASGCQGVFERYLQQAKPSTALLSASMSKTLLALLVGIAIDEGKLSLDEHVAAVLPDFRDSAFADDSVEDLLRMNSGVALKNSFRPGEASDNQTTNPMIEPFTDMRAYLAGKKDKDPAGKVFNYNGAVTAVLGLMLSARTGVSNTEYLSTHLWGPMGAESPAYWIKNRAGQEGVQGQFVATLRDNGQKIFVDPVAKVVIVHTGNSPDAEFNGNDHLFPIRDAIAASLRTR